MRLGANQQQPAVTNIVKACYTTCSNSAFYPLWLSNNTMDESLANGNDYPQTNTSSYQLGIHDGNHPRPAYIHSSDPSELLQQL